MFGKIFSSKLQLSGKPTLRDFKISYLGHKVILSESSLPNDYTEVNLTEN